MKRALVLSGGGPVGIAWETGILAGLEREGIDLGDADLIVGTSAGSVVGAQRALGRTGEELLRALVDAPPAELPADRPGSGDPAAGGSPAPSGARPGGLAGLVEVMSRPRDPSHTAKQLRAEIGAFARVAQTLAPAAFVRRLGESTGLLGQPWPDRFLCTSVDTDDGSFVTWDRPSEVALESAVAASCAVPGIFPPIEIRGRHYMDGGIRSVTSADLAKGHDLVVVLALVAGPLGALVHGPLAREREMLESGGTRVVVIVPDEANKQLIGVNFMDTGRSAVIAEAGAKQAQHESGELRALWHGGH